MSLESIDFSHHAYCIDGLCDIEDILETIEKRKAVSARGNPNVWAAELETLGIDESREIQNFQSKKAIAGNLKFIVIKAHSLTRESQNSLLKVLEEPSADTFFILSVPSAEILLPTLRSRFEEIRLTGARGEEKEGEEFISSGIKERFGMIEPIIREGDKKAALLLLQSIVEAIRKNNHPSNFSKNEIESIERILQYISYLKDRAPSVKLMLESTAVMLPKMK